MVAADQKCILAIKHLVLYKPTVMFYSQPFDKQGGSKRSESWMDVIHFPDFSLPGPAAF